ncbi:hypothetical protein NODU109028_07760 [Nocardioides dubius]|uniref:Uncharacterized protein n=1 Tax=Nocardioides dubius TaxID=317019 RepID=A0ABP4EJG4_9ACTN
MDLLSLVQWLGCVAALCGGVVVLWQPEEEPLTRRRLAALVLCALVVVLPIARWGIWDDAAADPVQRATAITGLVGLAALVVLALLLNVSASASRAARRVHRRAAGALCAGFAVAVSATLQVDQVGEPWTQTQWLLVIGQLLGCVAMVLAEPEG